MKTSILVATISLLLLSFSNPALAQEPTMDDLAMTQEEGGGRFEDLSRSELEQLLATVLGRLQRVEEKLDISKSAEPRKVKTDTEKAYEHKAEMVDEIYRAVRFKYQRSHKKYFSDCDEFTIAPNLIVDEKGRHMKVRILFGSCYMIKAAAITIRYEATFLVDDEYAPLQLEKVERFNIDSEI